VVGLVCHHHGTSQGTPPFEFVEDELLILKGRLEGEEDVLKKGVIGDDSERTRYIAHADWVGNAIVGIEVPPSVG